MPPDTPNLKAVPLLTCVERCQHDGFLRRSAADGASRRLAEAGVPIREIVRRTGRSRKVVRAVVRGSRTDVFRVRMSTLEPFLPHLETEWAGGCRNGAELWQRLRGVGFPGALRVVTEWVTRQRRAGSAPDALPRKPPSARVIARLMTSKRARLSAAEAKLVATLQNKVPALHAASVLVDRFHAMLRSKTSARLAGWLSDAKDGLLAGFAQGIKADRKAVEAAITEPWSNGQTEGQITKLKLL